MIVSHRARACTAIAVVGRVLCGCGFGDAFQGVVPPDAAADVTFDAGVDATEGFPPIIVRSDDSAPPSTPDAGDAPVAAADAAACDLAAEPKDTACLVDDLYGVFVATSGTDGAAGTRNDPVRTLAAALPMTSLPARSRVYVCQGSYAEQVVIAHEGVSIYGGFDCVKGWAWTGGQVSVTGPTPLYALRVDATTRPLSIEDISFAVPDATGRDGTGAGASSIAALVNASMVTFRRCAFTAGVAGNGGAGRSGINYVALDGGTPAGSDEQGGAGGAGGVVACANGDGSQGGVGGRASVGGGADGGAGSSSPPTSSPDGIGGIGGITFCGAGAHAGANGDPRSAGAQPSTLGTLSAAGFHPSAGGDGLAGRPGQGGGGGGGLATVGGTGGGGGGCGGGGAGGGQGGGASIALAIVASAVSLDGCMLTSQVAGTGGDGASGQPGQPGGANGPSLSGGCPGAYGGNGSGGSGGAGGTGGISVCIAYTGSLPSQVGTGTCNPGRAGSPGTHGSGGAHGVSTIVATGTNGRDGADGMSGVSQPALQLP